MQCMAFRSSPAPSQEWAEYLHQIQSMHCPFLKESRREAISTHSVYTTERDGADLQGLSLGVAVVHAEILRAACLMSENSAVRHLRCENVILRSTSSSLHDFLLQIHWTHWALKSLYTEAGLAFGKFWPNERSRARTGELIPDPPEPFLSIRPTIVKPDVRFFSRSSYLAKKHSESSIGSAAMFEALDCQSLRSLRFELIDSPDLANSSDFAIEMASRLSSDNLLKRILAVDGLASILG